MKAAALEQPWRGHRKAQWDGVNFSPCAEDGKLAPVLCLSCTFFSWSVFKRKIGFVCPKVLGCMSLQNEVFTYDWSCKAALTFF